MTGTELAQLSEAVRLLSEARSLDDITHIRNIAQAAEEYARAEQLGEEAERYAREIRVRAARKAGERLREMAETGERMKQGTRTDLVTGRDQVPPGLAELGIDKNHSARWQRIAAVPEPEFEEAVKQGAGETAIARLLRVVTHGCPVCGKEIRRSGSTYCSLACAGQAKRVQQPACQWCGDKPVNTNKSKYCSRECSSIAVRSGFESRSESNVVRATDTVLGLIEGLRVVHPEQVAPELVAELFDALRQMRAVMRRLGKEVA